MAPKRIHNKSRHGCDQCKKRRVKCDEREPTCTNCVSRQEDCQYSRPFRPQRSHSVVNSNSNAQSPAPVGSRSPSIYSHFCSSRRQRELELMHHWFMKTCQSFTIKLTDLFRSHVVKEALKHEYLTDFIFALTSLHIASETSDPVSAASYVNIALQYQNNAVPNFRTALHNVTQSNCDAIFASSILIMACSVVSPLFPAGDNDIAKSSTDSILHLYDFINGISSIVDISRQWLESGPCRVVFRTRRRFERPTEDKTILPTEHLRHLNNTVTGTPNSLRHQTYERAIEWLERCFAEDKTMAVTWLAMAGKDFTKELQKREPMALMVFMYWGVLLDKLDEMWWAKCSGKRLVEELCGILNGHGNEWDKAKKWAKMEVGL